MSEMLTSPQNTDNRIDDVDKAHEMANAGNRLRTIAAMQRSAALLMEGMVSVGKPSHEITTALREKNDIGTRDAEQLKFGRIDQHGGTTRPDTEVADILRTHIAPSVDKQAGVAESAAAERYDEEKNK